MRHLFIAAALSLFSGLVVAQGAPSSTPAPATTPATTPAATDLEPAVNTSQANATPPATPAAAAKPPARPRAAAPNAAPRTGNARDRLDLDASQITGNRELPKVLYIVPWRRSDLGDMVARPVNSLLDEVLEPVDRDVFKRQNRYYEALQPDVVRTGSESPESPEK